MKLILLEIFSYVQIPLYWWLFKRYAKINVTGDMIAGTMIGMFNEFATEPLWTYHFKITIYKDTPLSVVLGWGVMFTLVTYGSQKMYCWFLKQPKILPYDKRIFIFDVIASTLIALPIEAFGLKMGVWDYNYDILKWNWGFIPFIHMPYEALVGYALLMLIGPTFVRYWAGALEGHPGEDVY